MIAWAKYQCFVLEESQQANKDDGYILSYMT
jgi:hypothetical protein